MSIIRSGLSLCGIALMLLTACGGSSNSVGAKHYTIAFVPGQTTDPFYITMQKGATDEARKLGVTLRWQGSANWSPQDQTTILASLLIGHPDALIIVPTDSDAMIPAMKQYVSQGIPVITTDTTTSDTSFLSSQITDDSSAGGALAADAIAKAIGGKGEVAVIRTNPGVSVSDARHDGFVQRIKTAYPNITVVADEYSHNDPTVAQTVAQAILLRSPNLAGIFAVNGNTTIGVAKGISAAGKQQQVWVAGYDANPALVDLLKAGSIKFLVIQKPADQGRLAVDFAYDLLTGKKDIVPPKVLTQDVVATTDNVNDPNISQYFYLANYSG